MPLASTIKLGLKIELPTRDRVAVVIHYVTQSNGFAMSGHVLGIIKTRAYTNSWESIPVIHKYYLQQLIWLPTTDRKWCDICDGFKNAAASQT